MFAGKPQALLDYCAAHPGVFDIVSTIAEQKWTDAKIDHLADIVRRGVLLSLEPVSGDAAELVRQKDLLVAENMILGFRFQDCDGSFELKKGKI